MADFEFAILGAGAMGSIIGAHLACAGHTVAMLARGERARQLEERGLAIRGLAEFSTPVRTLRDPAALESAGTLIVATKTPGTAQALEPLRRAEFGVALSVQNGPLKNEILVQAFGRERVLGALADTSGELLADGTVLFTRNVNIMIGELGGGDSERAQALARTIDQSGVRAAATPEIVSLEWSKFCGWVGLTSLSVTTRALTWKLLTDPDSALILARLVREMGVLALAQGIPLSDRSILPTATLCSGSESEAVAILLEAGSEYRTRAPGHRLSALQDLEAGRPLEVNETLGYAHDKARELALELPLLECFRRLVAAIDRAQRAGARARSPAPRPSGPSSRPRGRDIRAAGRSRARGRRSCETAAADPRCARATAPACAGTPRWRASGRRGCETTARCRAPAPRSTGTRNSRPNSRSRRCARSRPSDSAAAPERSRARSP